MSSEALDPTKKADSAAYPAVCRFIEARLGLSTRRGTLPGSLEQFIERKMAALGIVDETAFANVLSCASEALMKELIEAVTVPYSWLFRDYEQLYDAVKALKTPESERRRLQVWVPACASGEDAYSISSIACLLGKPIELLATDINARALQVAVSGNYGAWSARSIPESHARQMSLSNNGSWAFSADVRRQITFANHNLIESPPRSAHAHGGWDLVVCRNVLIYFARSQAQRVLGQLNDALAPEGLLVLGASDIVLEVPRGLRTVDIRGRLAFRKQRPSLDSACSEEHALNNGKDCALGGVLDVIAEAKGPPLRGEGEKSRASCLGRGRGYPPTGNFDDHSYSDDTHTGVEEMVEGILCYLSGELNAAAQSLREALFHCAQLWPASYYLALCYDELGRSFEAKREYQRTAALIARKVELPPVPNHDFSFLERDIGGIAKKRAAGQTK